jgi:hypothetical protein
LFRIIVATVASDFLAAVSASPDLRVPWIAVNIFVFLYGFVCLFQEGKSEAREP